MSSFYIILFTSIYRFRLSILPIHKFLYTTISRMNFCLGMLYKCTTALIKLQVSAIGESLRKLFLHLNITLQFTSENDSEDRFIPFPWLSETWPAGELSGCGKGLTQHPPPHQIMIHDPHGNYLKLCLCVCPNFPTKLQETQSILVGLKVFFSFMWEIDVVYWFSCNCMGTAALVLYKGGSSYEYDALQSQI